MWWDVSFDSEIGLEKKANRVTRCLGHGSVRCPLTILQLRLTVFILKAWLFILNKYRTTLNSQSDTDSTAAAVTTAQQNKVIDFSLFSLSLFCTICDVSTVSFRYFGPFNQKLKKWIWKRAVTEKKIQTTTQHKLKRLRHAKDEEKTDLVAHHLHTYFSDER